MTIKEVQEKTGISIRNLQYYSDEGIVEPKKETHGEYEYRNYSEEDVRRLQQVKIFKSLGMSLSEIKRIMNAPDYDSVAIFRKQIKMLEEKRDEINRMIAFAKLGLIGGIDILSPVLVDNLHSFPFLQENSGLPDLGKFINRLDMLDDDSFAVMQDSFRSIFVRFGELRGNDAESEEVQENVDALIAFLSVYIGESRTWILSFLQVLLEGGGTATEAADKTGGAGTAKIAADALAYRVRIRSMNMIFKMLDLFSPLRGRDLSDPEVKTACDELFDLISWNYGVDQGITGTEIMAYDRVLTYTLENCDDSEDKETLEYIQKALRYYGKEYDKEDTEWKKYLSAEMDALLLQQRQ